MFIFFTNQYSNLKLKRLIDGMDTLNDLEKLPVNPKNYRPLKDVHLNCVTIHANPFADPNVAQ